ncbi:MAG: radical SAM protein, partial [bacterium]|nr:radical SAM protein [bacterium]
KDTKASSLKTLDEIINIHPHFIRIHPTLVLKDTVLARRYLAGKYHPLSLAEAIEWCKEMVIRCKKANIPVARLGLQPSPELCKPGTVVAGPFHPAFGELVKSALAYDRMNVKLNEPLPETSRG